MKTWQLSARGAKRFYQGHPWVFSNELNHSPKGIQPGEVVTLTDPQGKFLARGFGNPRSLIALRVFARQEHIVVDEEEIFRRLQQASLRRVQWGMGLVSHRLCFAEADYIPGLVIDRFIGDKASAFVAEVTTAGMELLLGDRLAPLLLRFAQWQYESGLAPTREAAVIVKRDSAFRELEGLEKCPQQMAGTLSETELQNFSFKLMAFAQQEISLTTDLIHGQKTGFFLDQAYNVELMLRLLANQLDADKSSSSLNILDICCYVGQWGAQIAHLCAQKKRSVKAVLLDASVSALARAEANVKKFGASSEAIKQDVLNEWSLRGENSFDVVICDPPAFVKRAKDHAAGMKGYIKLNREAMKRVKLGGIFVSCSCSGNISDDDFLQILQQAMSKSGCSFQWLYKGGQSPDHPRLLEFPEGAYLKSWIGVRV